MNKNWEGTRISRAICNLKHRKMSFSYDKTKNFIVPRWVKRFERYKLAWTRLDGNFRRNISKRRILRWYWESIIQDAKRRETRQPLYFCVARLASAVSTWSKLSRRAPGWQDLFEATLRFLFALISSSSSSSSTSATFSVDRSYLPGQLCAAPVSPSWIGHCNYLI